MIPFGEWLPDLPDFNNPGCNIATNVIPGDDSYQAFPDKVVYSDSIGSSCIGFAGLTNSAGDYYNFAGSVSKLYLLSSGSYGEVGAAYAANIWKYAQYGDDAIAVTIGNYPQKYTMGIDSAFSDLTTSFKAAYAASVRGFLLFGNTVDSEPVPNRLRWSAYLDHTNYVVSPTTQSDYQDLPEVDGEISGIVGGSYAVVFQERAISRLTYVGSPIVFQVDRLESRGTRYPNSIIELGSSIAYLAEDGFYIFDGSRSVSIGDGRINKTFFNDLNQEYPEKVYGAIDPINHLLIWSYVARGSSQAFAPTRLIIFNYSTNTKYRWSTVEITTGCIGRALLSDVDINNDYLFWTASNSFLACFDTDFKLNTFTGPALSATIETTEVELIQGKRSNISLLRPHISLKNGASMAALWTSRKQSDFDTWHAVAWSSTLGLFAAVGGGTTNYIKISDDGINWTAKTGSGTWQAICWSSFLGMFIAVSSGGSNRIVTSTDGLTWTPRTPSESVSWLGVASSTSVVVAVSSDATQRVMKSTNGTAWTGVTVSLKDWRAVCWSSDLSLFVAVGDGVVMTSTDGTTWVDRTPAEVNTWVSVCWSSALGLFCAVSRDGTNRVMTSTNGITWTAVASPVQNTWAGICFSEEAGIFVAVSGESTDGVMVSADGSYWVTHDNADAESYEAIIYSPELNLFVAVGGSGAIMTSYAESAGAVTLQIGTRDNSGSLPIWGDEISPLENGDIPAHSNSRFHRFRVNISGGFNNAAGVDVLKASPAGSR